MTTRHQRGGFWMQLLGMAILAASAYFIGWLLITLFPVQLHALWSAITAKL